MKTNARPFEDDREHSLGIKAVNHLAHAYPDRDELAAWYMRVFGMRIAASAPITARKLRPFIRKHQPSLLFT